MARFKDRQKARELRMTGKTYSQIRQILGVSKSTLSDWLKSFPLTQEQLELLRTTQKHSRYLAIEKTRIIKQQKREARIQATYTDQKKRWLALNQRELELAGLFLYWGEGNKRLNGSVMLNNTDPKVLKFAKYWLRHGLLVPEDKIKVDLHLYSDMDIQYEMSYWSKKLQLPLSQFRKPYIKESTRTFVEHKGFGHGTCGLVVNDVLLKEKIMMAITALADCYSEGK